jgi:predicted small lipoprotein YifL
MKKWMILAGTLASALVLAGCGKVGVLEPMAGKALPPRPYGATTTPTAPQLATPATQTRPERSDELLTSSEHRRGDDFDLPPPN